MNLGELRTALLNRSGERQFEDDTDSLDDFINDGQKYLDEMVTHPKAEKYTEDTLETDGTSIVVSDLKSLKEIRVIDDQDSEVSVQPVSLNELLRLYPGWTSSDSGTPLYWANDGSLGTSSQVGFRFMPPANADFTVRIVGIFYTSFSGDEDADGGNSEYTSWWGDNYPSLLIQAAQKAMADSFGRLEEVSEWERIMAPQIRRISNRTGSLAKPRVNIGQM